jgi:hypothetical protein
MNEICGEIELTFFFTAEFDVFIYHSIARNALRRSSFESNSIRVSVHPQNPENRGPTVDGAHCPGGLFPELSAERLAQSTRTQKQSCSAIEELSIGTEHVPTGIVRWLKFS